MRLIAHVDALMHAQVVGAGEALPAHDAHARLDAGVREFVLAQLVLDAKPFVAGRAAVALLARVLLHVGVDVGGVVAAYVAQ